MTLLLDLPAPLDPFLYQKAEWCVRCAGEQTFVPVFETEGGRFGYCLGCGENRFVPFTRTTFNEEVA